MTSSQTRTPKIVLFLLLVITSLISCSGDDDNDTTDVVQSDYFLTADIDGTTFVANGSPMVSNNSDQTQAYTIIGIGDNTERITLTLAGPPTVGTFETQTSDKTFLSYVSSTAQVWGAAMDGSSGSITISAVDADSVEGTFTFTGTNPIDQTTTVFDSGKFNAKK